MISDNLLGPEAERKEAAVRQEVAARRQRQDIVRYTDPRRTQSPASHPRRSWWRRLLGRR